MVPKEVPKFILQAQEVVSEVPLVLNHERPVEVPVTQVAEVVVQVAKVEVEPIEKHVPVYRTEAREQIVEVPQVFYEERLAEVPQLQIAEVIKQVPLTQIQEVAKHVPKIVETKVVQKVVQVPSTLVVETPVEVPKVMTQEVVTQKASGSAQQRIVQTGYTYQRHISREEAVTSCKEAVTGGVHEASVIGVREYPMQPGEVERMERRVTEQVTSAEAPVLTTVNMPQEGERQMQVVGGPQAMLQSGGPGLYGGPGGAAFMSLGPGPNGSFAPAGSMMHPGSVLQSAPGPPMVLQSGHPMAFGARNVMASAPPMIVQGSSFFQTGPTVAMGPGMGSSHMQACAGVSAALCSAAHPVEPAAGGHHPILDADSREGMISREEFNQELL